MALDKERMVPTIIDMVPRSAKDAELRSLTGFLRNLSRHTDDKDDMGQSSFFFFLFPFCRNVDVSKTQNIKP